MINQLKHRLQTERFAIISAERSNLSPAENLIRTRQLHKAIIGYEHNEAEGIYGNLEASFLIWGITELSSIALAHQFDQESVLTRKALVYTSGKVELTDLDNIVFDQNLKDYYTKVIINGEEIKFFIPLKS